MPHSEENPAEYGFYRCCIKKVEINAEIQSRFFDNYDNFLKSKVSELAKQYRKLGVILEKRVKEILSRPDIDFRNVTSEEREKIEANLTHQDVKIFRRKQSVLEQILLLNKKINQFEIKINPAKVESQVRTLLKSSIITEDEYKMVKQMLW